MVNKYWFEPHQKAQQQEMLTKLKSGEVIIKNGKIIPSPEGKWIQEKEKLRKKFQARREAWKQKQQADQAEKEWQKEWSRMERCLTELSNGGKADM